MENLVFDSQYRQLKLMRQELRSIKKKKRGFVICFYLDWQLFLDRLDLEVESNQRENQAFQILDQIVECS